MLHASSFVSKSQVNLKNLLVAVDLQRTGNEPNENSLRPKFDFKVESTNEQRSP